MFHTQLALLPAMETEGLELDLMMDDPYGEGVEGPGGAPAELVSATVGNSYVVNLAKMGIKQVSACSSPVLYPQTDCSYYSSCQLTPNTTPRCKTSMLLSPLGVIHAFYLGMRQAKYSTATHAPRAKLTLKADSGVAVCPLE